MFCFVFCFGSVGSLTCAGLIMARRPRLEVSRGDEYTAASCEHTFVMLERRGEGGGMREGGAEGKEVHCQTGV